MSDYPEHDKLAARKAEHEVLTDFLVWLDSQSRYAVGEWVEYQVNGDTVLVELDHRGKSDMIARYFGINRDAFMAEKDAMLEAHRQYLDRTGL